MYKYPLVICMVGSVYFKKKAVKAHADLLKKSFYLRIDNSQKMLHNGLKFGLLFLYACNLTSFIVGALFSASQYAYGLSNRYYKRFEYNEMELRHKYIKEIKCYNRALNS